MLMLTKRWQGLLLSCLAVILTLAFVMPAAAQRDSGIMRVRVVDPDGLPLSGVAIVARGPVGTQTQYTGVDGTARFPGLYPGEGYTATFTLEGFNVVVREDVVIQAQRTTEFTITMELATVQETVTVTGETPVVDVKSANIAGLYTSDLIDRAPTASGLWAGVLDHVPGLVSSLDVGGGGYFRPRAWGSEVRNNSFNVNGGDTTDPAAVGASSSAFSISSFEEVSVSLAGQDIEIKTPGVNVNMVTKSGSNDWHGGFRYFYEGESLVSKNVDQELMDEGIEEGTPNELLSDLDLRAGGPIWRDRAWFFADFWNFRTRRVILGLEERFVTQQRNLTMNLNGQIDENNKISGRYLRTSIFFNNRGAGRARPYLGRVQHSGSHIPQLQWQSVISQNVFSDVRFSTVRSNFPLVRRDAESSEAGVPYRDWSATWDFGLNNYVSRPSNPTSEFFDERDTDNLNATVSWYVTGENVSHDVKFGGNFTNINWFSPFNYPNGYRRYVDSRDVGTAAFDPNNNPNWAQGVPVEVRIYNAPIAWGESGQGNAGASPDCFVLNADCWKPNNAYNQRGRAWGLFGQDVLTIANRVTVTFGLRFDRAYNWNPEQNRIDSPWANVADGLRNPDFFRGGSFEGQDPLFHWNDLVPRFGLIYDVLGDGRWALKFNYSRYAEQLGISFGGATNVNGVASEDWNWFDPNGDGIFQFGEHVTIRSQFLPGEGARVDPDLTSPLTNEFTFGVEHEVFDNVLLSVNGIIRGRTNDVGTVNSGRPFGVMLTNERCIAECTPTYSDGSVRPLEDPWLPTQQVDPGADGIIGTDDDGGPVMVYVLDPRAFNTSVFLTTNTNTWGFSDDLSYRGVSFVLSKRWSDNWQVLASYDYGRGYNTDAGTSPNGVFNGRRQELFGSRPHNFKITGNYLIAEPIGINLGLFVRAQSGEPVRADFTYNDELLEPPFSPFDFQSNTFINIDARGEGNNGRPEREEFVTIVDVRAEKQLTVGRYGVLHFYFDVFNLFNSNVKTAYEWTLGDRYRRTLNILPPRVIRLGGAWDF